MSDKFDQMEGTNCAKGSRCGWMMPGQCSLGRGCPNAPRAAMTNQPIREALIEKLRDVFDGDDPCEETCADAALSILSTALAERDARIAELEGALMAKARQFHKTAGKIKAARDANINSFSEYQMGNFRGVANGFEDAAEMVRAMLAKESERG